MKKQLLFLLAPALMLLASCQQYDNTIQATYPDQQSVMRPLDQATRDSAAAGLVLIDSSHAGNPMIFEMKVKVSPTWRQAWKWQGERGNRWLFIFGASLIIISLLIYVLYTSRGGQAISSLALVVAALVGVIIAAGSVEWEKWGMDQELTKALYDHLMKTFGNLGAFWDTVRIK